MNTLKFYLLTILLFSSFPAFSQEGEINSVCGQIETEQLTIPSYKFMISDAKGNRIENLQTEGKIRIDEYIWTGTGISILDALEDAYWKPTHHDISIPIMYNSSEAIYVSQKISEIKIAHRRSHRFSLKKDCWDKVALFSFEFYENNSNSAYYYFHFPNITINKILLPNNKNTISLKMQVASFTVDNIH